MHLNFRPLLLLTALLLPLTLTAAKNYPPNIPEAETIAYKTIGDVTMNLYVFKPDGWKATDTRPAAVFFFGGGWNAGSPEQFVPQCKALQKRGMVAITADYRVANRNQTKAIKCVEDARDAIRWTRTHAKELGIDPNRVASGGGSAGGHIAACLGTIAPPAKEKVSSKPNAMLLFNPACVLASIGEVKLDPAKQATMNKRMGVSDSALLSPAHHVSKSAPPCILFHGTGDTIVPFLTAQIFSDKMKEAGVRCDLMDFKGKGHGFFNKGESLTQTIAQMDSFLVSLGWLKKK
ncbi:alpha/beta hydrolase [bacterium]|nr:alpha/beta hydrolase [bacterium]